MMCSTNDRISILCQFECELTTRFARNEFLQHFVLPPTPKSNHFVWSRFYDLFADAGPCAHILWKNRALAGVHVGFTSRHAEQNDRVRLVVEGEESRGGEPYCLWSESLTAIRITFVFCHPHEVRVVYHEPMEKIGVEKRNMADSYHFPSPKKRQPTLSMQIENVYTHKSSRLFCDCHLFTGIIRCDKSLSAFNIYKAWLQRYTDHSPWN